MGRPGLYLRLARHRKAPAYTPGIFQPFHRQRRKAMQTKLRAFLLDESGATAIEYGLIAAGISIAIIAVVNGIGTGLNAKFKSISTQLK
jgi:pilus assembly protein Flp/PilA